MKSTFSLLLTASFLIGACAPQVEKPKPAEKKPAVEGPKLVGRIATIPADKRFVLIQSYGKWEVESGQILTTRGPEDRTANLRATGEKLGEFAAADLQSGTLEIGDAVYFQHIVKPPAPPTTPASPPSPSTPHTEGISKNN
ncbi:MAG TPA: hypothetical protein VF258_05920 [Luteolibacter sp.]